MLVHICDLENQPRSETECHLFENSHYCKSCTKASQGTVISSPELLKLVKAKSSTNLSKTSSVQCKTGGPRKNGRSPVVFQPKCLAVETQNSMSLEQQSVESQTPARIASTSCRYIHIFMKSKSFSKGLSRPQVLLLS